MKARMGVRRRMFRCAPPPPCRCRCQCRSVMIVRWRGSNPPEEVGVACREEGAKMPLIKASSRCAALRSRAFQDAGVGMFRASSATRSAIQTLFAPLAMPLIPGRSVAICAMMADGPAPPPIFVRRCRAPLPLPAEAPLLQRKNQRLADSRKPLRFRRRKPAAIWLSQR